MRRHRHLPQFHSRDRKLNNGTRRFAKEKLKHIGRRTHGISPREAPAPSVLARAEKRVRLYMNAAARRRAL